jgi:class 3 adenylate cyclase
VPARRHLLVCVLLPLWAVCFGLSLRAVWGDTPFPPVLVTFHEPGFPVVVGPRSPREAKGPLQTGDVLLRWGEQSLRDAGEVELFSAVAEQTPANHVARVLVQRNHQELTLHAPTGTYRKFWPRLPAALIFCLVAVLLLYRGPRDKLTHTFVAMLFGGAFLFVCTFSGSVFWLHTASLVQAIGVSTLTVFGLRGMLLFPRGVPPSSRVVNALPFLFVVLGPLDVERTRGWLLPQVTAHRLAFALYVLVFLTLIVDTIRTYGRSNPVERRKIKWVLWGTFVAVVLPAFAAAVALVSPVSGLDFYVSVASLGIIPLCLFVAIVYYNLFDINRLLSATATLSLVVFVGVCVIVWSVPRLGSLMHALFDTGESVAQLLVASALALAVVVGQRTLQPWVDRFFFRERAALEQGVLELTRDAGNADKPRETLARVAEGLTRLLQPECAVLYVRSGAAFESVFAHGAAITPAFSSHNGLVETLSARRAPLSLESGYKRRPDGIDAVSRALISALDARVILPFFRGDELVGMLCLGSKESGDVFVSSDLALLGTLAHAVSERLSRFEKDALLADLEKARATLKRYVPGAIADELEQGGELTEGERSVTLLFVDIRGYSRYAEARSAGEVFSTINQHTREVSAIARQYGGHVVEFNGDGMMVVFGAPRPLEHKEQAAVAAGLAMLDRIERAADLPKVSANRLSVGVGIASGMAFTGNIQAVDRMIWTAIGATTNRAARLQALTRDLGVGMVIDEETFRALQGDQGRFIAKRGVLLRGHSRIQTLYALTRGSPSRGQVETDWAALAG